MAATTPVCGDVLSYRSGNPLLRLPHHSTGRGEVICDQTQSLHGRGKQRRQRPERSKYLATVHVGAPRALLAEGEMAFHEVNLTKVNVAAKEARHR